MVAPASPSVATRAVYYSYAVPAPTVVNPTTQLQTAGAAAFNNVTYNKVTMDPDIGPPGVPLPATVVSVAGVTPDWVGTRLIVHLPDGTTAVRYAGFATGQTLPSVATWTSNGSNPAIARWAMVDTAG